MRATAVFVVLFLSTMGATPALAGFSVCGQPVSTGSTPVASDALFILQVAVGSATCELCVCDVDSGQALAAPGDHPNAVASAVTASDALRVLKRAVGQAVTLTCPACTRSCDETSAPACGGLCGGGGTCAPDPFDPDFCECVDACGLADAPQCNAACEEPGTVCTNLTITTVGGPSTDACFCLPEGAATCPDANAPDCFGACAPGSVCVSDGVGACICETQPLQGPCASASPPACGGTCSGGEICQADGAGGCACGPSTGEEPCLDEDAPTCGGACPDGEFCAIDFLGVCDCFEPCELSQAPSCGGACFDPGAVCTHKTIDVGGTPLDFCDCE